jgi:hypothetical protein
VRQSLERIIKAKLEVLDAQPVTGNVEHEEDARHQVWEDAFAYKFHARDQFSLSQAPIVVTFREPDEAAQRGAPPSLSVRDAASVNPSELEFRGGQPETLTPATNLGRSDRQFVGALRATLSSELKIAPRDYQPLRCPRPDELKKKTDAIQAIPATPDLLSIQGEDATILDEPEKETGKVDALDRCRNEVMTEFMRNMPDYRLAPAIIIAAGQQRQWVDAIAFATLYERHLKEQNTPAPDISAAMRRLYLIADGRTNMLNSPGYGETYDNDVRSRVNVFIPFTGYRTHASRASKKFVTLMQSSQEAEREPPLDTLTLFEKPASISAPALDCRAVLVANQLQTR